MNLARRQLEKQIYFSRLSASTYRLIGSCPHFNFYIFIQGSQDQFAKQFRGFGILPKEPLALRIHLISIQEPVLVMRSLRQMLGYLCQIAWRAKRTGWLYLYTPTQGSPQVILSSRHILNSPGFKPGATYFEHPGLLEPTVKWFFALDIYDPKWVLLLVDTLVSLPAK